MDEPSRIFEIEHEGDTLILTPDSSLGALTFDQVERELGDILQVVQTDPARNVVIDFRKTEYFGSSAVEFFIRLWRIAKSHSGRIALCGLSTVEAEVLQATRLDSLWPVCSSRAEAIEAVRSHGAQGKTGSG